MPVITLTLERREGTTTPKFCSLGVPAADTRIRSQSQMSPAARWVQPLKPVEKRKHIDDSVQSKARGGGTADNDSDRGNSMLGTDLARPLMIFS